MDIIKKRDIETNKKTLKILNNVKLGLPLMTEIGSYDKKIKIRAPPKKFGGYEEEISNIGVFNVNRGELDFTDVKDFMDSENLSVQVERIINKNRYYPQDTDPEMKYEVSGSTSPISFTDDF